MVGRVKDLVWVASTGYDLPVALQRGREIPQNAIFWIEGGRLDVVSCSANMNVDLHDDSLLSELHHFLWIEPFENKGVFDSGWSCRDHAFVVGCLLRAAGKEVRLAHGKNMCIQGPNGSNAPIGIGQQAHEVTGHTWLKSDTGRIIDLSPRLDMGLPPAWRPIAFTGIVDGVWQPADQGIVAGFTTPFQYRQAIAKATHREKENAALYLEQTKATFSVAIVTDAVEYINSPLTDRLRQFQDPEIYSKCVLHLRGFIDGARESLVELPQLEAWKRVSEQAAGATAVLLRLMGLAS